MKIKSTDVQSTCEGGFRLTPRASHGGRACYNFFGKDQNLWRHQTRMSPGLDRDWQRTKVYSAERVVRRGAPMSYADTLRFVAKVLNSATFQRRWGVRTLEVRDGRGRTRAAAYGSSYITLPDWARTRDVVLHEIAHTLCPSWEQHGRLFARTFLELTRLFQGKAEHDALRDSFRERGVRFTPRRKASFTVTKAKRRSRAVFDPFDDLLPRG